MPISTYAELATAVNSFSTRPDRSGDIDTYIALAEEAIYNGIGDIRPLRVQGMVTSTTAGLPTVPTDFLEAIRLTTNQSSITSVVTYVPPQNLSSVSNGSAAQSIYFTVMGDQIETWPAISGYTLHYYKRFSALSGTATTNWILTNAPGIYLHGCLMALYKMTRDPAGEQGAMRDFAASMAGLKNRDYQAKTHGSVLQVRAN